MGRIIQFKEVFIDISVKKKFQHASQKKASVRCSCLLFIHEIIEVVQILTPFFLPLQILSQQIDPYFLMGFFLSCIHTFFAVGSNLDALLSGKRTMLSPGQKEEVIRKKRSYSRIFWTTHLIFAKATHTRLSRSAAAAGDITHQSMCYFIWLLVLLTACLGLP